MKLLILGTIVVICCGQPSMTFHKYKYIGNSKEELKEIFFDLGIPSKVEIVDWKYTSGNELRFEFKCNQEFELYLGVDKNDLKSEIISRLKYEKLDNTYIITEEIKENQIILFFFEDKMEFEGFTFSC